MEQLCECRFCSDVKRRKTERDIDEFCEQTLKLSCYAITSADTGTEINQSKLVLSLTR